MKGTHQIDNCAVALATLFFAQIELSVAQVNRGAHETFWPGRTEVLAQSPMTLIDGAHNPAGVQTLAHTLMGPLGFPVHNWILLVGFSQGHDPKAWAEAWPSSCQPTEVWVVPPNMPRALSLADTLPRLQAVWPHAKPMTDLKSAFEKAREILQKQEGGLCLAGSLYLVGEARALFRNEPLDPQFPLF